MWFRRHRAIGDCLSFRFISGAQFLARTGDSPWSTESLTARSPRLPHLVIPGSPNLGTNQRPRPRSQRRWVQKGEWGRWITIMRFWADKRRLGLRSRLSWVCTAAGAANAWEWDLCGLSPHEHHLCAAKRVGRESLAGYGLPLTTACPWLRTVSTVPLDCIRQDGPDGRTAGFSISPDANLMSDFVIFRLPPSKSL